MSSPVGAGSPEPLGVTPCDDGINVAVFSANASAIKLCLFDAAGEREEGRIELPERTGEIVHGFIPGVAVGARYGLRAYGAYDPASGHRFNPAKLLLDPYARALDRPFVLHPSLAGAGPDGGPDGQDSAPHMPKAIVTGEIAPAKPLAPSIAWSRTVVYELHVRGYTKRHPRVPEPLRGTFAGLAHPAGIEHLLRLGITSVELLPVAAAIDEWHLGRLGLTNYWGYNPVGWFAPDPRLAPGGIAEVRAAVDALHAAGIEVLLDVVFNHSGESDDCGPTVSMRGLDNASYYRLRPDDRARYVNDAGCGNVLACDRPHIVRLVLDALRYWVAAAGVDGFRFDLATTLGRLDTGFDVRAPLLAAIAQDPLLRDRKMIAEPWDIGPGGYQLGAFPSSWGEWNDTYRDTVRRFFRGDPGQCGDLATRFAGSADVLSSRKRPASRSVNFVTAHDGFTLADLVGYASKHNEANGENNRDGTDSNFSWNHGVEGPASDPEICAARAQSIRGLLATLLFSRGTPMLPMGDELGRTQQGNNNAYSQDGPLAWMDWEAADASLLDFASRLIALRQAHPALRAEAMLTGVPHDDSAIPDVEWQRADGSPMREPDWQDPNNHTLIAALYTPARDSAAADRVVVVIHADAAPVTTRLPEARTGHGWTRAIDSSQPELAPPGVPADVTVEIAPRSVVLFVESPRSGATRRASGIESTLLSRLAAAAGIAPGWWDVVGTYHTTPPDTQRALLAAMGLGVESSEDVRARLVELSRKARCPLPETAIVAADVAGEILAPIDPTQPGPLVLVLETEDGLRSRIVADPRDGRIESGTCADGRPVARGAIALPALPMGVHRLTLESDPLMTCALVAAPPSCHVPEALRDARRAFGVVAHLYSLRRAGDLGIGDYTTLAAFSGASAGRGAATIGLNPLHMMFERDRERASPYQPSDRRFLDPIYIDVVRVPDFADSPEAASLLDRDAAAIAALETGKNVNYTETWRIKRNVLDECHRSFQKRGPNDPLVREYAAYVADGGEALARFALFEAIAAAHPRKTWQDWPQALRGPEARGARRFGAEHRSDVEFALYLQWNADRQLGEAAAAARKSGLSIGFYRDLAIGAAPDGSEAWTDPEGFVRGVSIGAPPDPFAVSGQVWGVPPPNPVTLALGGYARFRALIAANLRHAGALRIDHVMGLARLFFVPDGTAARDGAYVEYPLDHLLSALALESVRHRALIVGEDLGTVPEGFRERLDAANILSSVVVWLEREGGTFRQAGTWRRKSAASISTHDLPTIAGWWSGADLAERHALANTDAQARANENAEREQDRNRLTTVLRQDGALAADEKIADATALAVSMHRDLARSPCALALVQADDLAGEVDALNLPATDRERPNWRRRHVVAADSLWRTPIGTAAAEDLRERAPARPAGE